MLRTTLLLFLVACGGASKPVSVASAPPPAAAPAPSPSSETAPAPSPVDITVELTRFGELRDQMCACADKACAQKIEQTVEEWSQSLVSKYPEQPDLTDDQEQALMAVATEFSTCAQKLYEADDEPSDEPS